MVTIVGKATLIPAGKWDWTRDFADDSIRDNLEDAISDSIRKLGLSPDRFDDWEIVEK